nr:retrovirus-related Pol polyprotein from transposon TNT 1-94 [Tanacetum cinerariifolium]
MMMWSQKVVKGWLQEAEVLTEVRVAIRIKKHRSQSHGRYSNKSCKYCKKLGHIVFDCYKLKNKLERECKRKNEKKPEKAVEVAIAKGDSDGDVYLSIDTENSRDELIVDSGCTFHRIHHRIIGKGNIQVKMQDGVFRTITGVRHVLDLKRNLISLSTLEVNGCKYSGEGGVMKIFKGALALMKAIQSGGLYVLQGTIVYGTTEVATSKASLDDSKLWHYRLGHTGEKCMKNLAKKGLIRVSCNLEFCEHCVFGKQKRVSFSPGIHRTRDALDYIQSDLWGISYYVSRRTPQQNGVAERINRIIMEKVRCMLSHANLDTDFWVEAATTASYLINRSPHRSFDGNIAEILWSCNFVDYSKLRFFGCPIYVYVNKGKLVHRAVKCIFLGCGFGVKGYRVWCPDPKYRKIIHSRDVTFNKDVIINSGKDLVPPYNFDNNHTEGKVEFEFDIENSTHTQPLYNDEHIKTQDDGNMPTSLQSQPQTEYLLARDRERRQVNSLQDLRIINVKDGIPRVESNRYKARYAVRGFDQGEGIDVNEVFFLVVRHTSIRVLLSIVALQDLELEQLDVKTAFLHGHLEEEIYVEQPEGFKVPGKEDHVCRLKKSLYGLKQSPRQWNCFLLKINGVLGSFVVNEMRGRKFFERPCLCGGSRHMRDYLNTLSDIATLFLLHRDRGDYSSHQKWHDGESNKGLGRSSEDGMSVITDKLNDLGRDMRKLKESLHAIQFGCEMCGGRHLGKDCQYKEEIKSIKATGYRGTTNDIESAKHPIESSKRHDAYEEWMQRFREIIGKSLKKHDSKIKNLEKKVEQLAQVVHAFMTNESKSVNQVKTVATKSSLIIHYRSCSASLDSNMVLCTFVVPNLIEQENVKKTGEGNKSPRPTPIISTLLHCGRTRKYILGRFGVQNFTRAHVQENKN